MSNIDKDAQRFDAQTRDALSAVLSKVDFNTLPREEVIADIVSQAKQFSFRMLIASALLEEIGKRDKGDSNEKE
jgi:hypothetical protein